MLRSHVLIALCFAVALGVMAFIPQLMESSPGTEEYGLTSNPDCLGASSPTADEQRTFLFSIRTGSPVIELPESLSPNRNTFHRLIITPSRPAESLQETEDNESSSNAGRFKVGSTTADERQTFLSPTTVPSAPGWLLITMNLGESHCL
jgi:hypothetical protein